MCLKEMTGLSPNDQVTASDTFGGPLPPVPDCGYFATVKRYDGVTDVEIIECRFPGMCWPTAVSPPYFPPSLAVYPEVSAVMSEGYRFPSLVIGGGRFRRAIYRMTKEAS